MIIKSGNVINNRYEIKNFLGEGATARVWSAYDRKQGFDVALKIQQPQTGENKISNMDIRFSMEGTALLSFDNKNIVKVFELFKIDGSNVIVMELLKGKTIHEHLKEKKFFTNKESIKYTIQILQALSCMHKQEIMHRDLKPQNIVINYDGKLKLMDFGIIQQSQNQDLTKDQSIIGTISYLAPEIIRHEKASPSSEIWSLGILLYQMLTGVVPFKGGDLQKTALKIIGEKPLPPSQLNPNIDPILESIILKMLEKEKFKRYRSTDSVLDAISEYINHDSKLLKPSKDNKTKETIKKPKKDKLIKLIPFLLGIGVLIAIIGIIIGTVF